AHTRQMLRRQQRSMFIVASACTISHLVKAFYQMTWILISVFQLTTWTTFIRDAYPYPHYMAIYVGSIALVIVSPKVRRLLTFTDFLTRNSVASQSTSSNLPRITTTVTPSMA
ncbi:hypothetical protein PMAYCL1PPCAC_26236, partial [Pristionchus mayeri]